MVDFNPKIIKVFELGRVYSTVSYVEFNNGYSHIIIDDNCYKIVNGQFVSPYIFPEAVALFKQLPDNPRVLVTRFYDIVEKLYEKEKEASV